MSKRPKKRMAKASLPKTNGTAESETKRVLKRAIRDKKEIIRLTAQLQQAAQRADSKLADVQVFVSDRLRKLSGPGVGG